MRLGDATAPVTATTGLPTSIRDAIRRLGARFDLEVLAATRALFEDQWDLSLPPEGKMHTDLAYGPDGRNKIDVFASGRRGARPQPCVSAAFDRRRIGSAGCGPRGSIASPGRRRARFARVTPCRCAEHNFR